MNSLPLVVLAWLIAAAWCCVVAIVLSACRKGQVMLHPLPPGNIEKDAPRLTVIVPARNEENCVETCIRSLLRQDYPNLEIIAVNDRSSDQTAMILDRLAAEFPDQVHAVHVTSLPEGWFGKPHALNCAMSFATGNIILFTDADCEFLAPSALRTAVVEFEKRGLNFYTIAVSYTMPTLRERLVVPACSEAVLQWLRPERVEDPNWPDTFANGAFIMVDRNSFQRVGGWRAVSTKVSEDFELARAFKRCGYRTGLGQAAGFYQTRSYASFRDSWNGWSRILAGSLTSRQLLTTVIRMSIMTMLPLGALLWATGQAFYSNDPTIFLQGAMPAFLWAYLVRTGLDVVVYRVMGAPTSAAILAPIGRLFVIAASIRAALARAGFVRTYWRGASFSANRLISPMPPVVTVEAQSREIRAELVSARHAAAS